MTDRERFDSIRRRFRAVQERRQAFRYSMLRKYGKHDPLDSWMTRGEVSKRESFRAAENRESDKMFALLARIGGRDWTTGAPWFYVMADLSYDDAVTTGALSTVPPVPYGYRPKDSENLRFLRRLEG